MTTFPHKTRSRLTLKLGACLAAAVAVACNGSQAMAAMMGKEYW
jgi:hypothetical protein